LLRSPLRFTRISSRFSRSRLHPILNVRHPHLSMDYAAPTKTPVSATGDGLVLGYRAGVKVCFLHTVQYHPTGVAFPEQAEGILITEKFRGAGANVLNIDGTVRQTSLGMRMSSRLVLSGKRRRWEKASDTWGKMVSGWILRSSTS
jgi:succinate dehydrogenase/fumarate reductase flavoprotein subunit